MPAVELGRLLQEVAALSNKFSDPDAYVKALEKMLEVYSTPVHQTGMVRGLRPVLFTYETSPLVLSQLLRELELQAKQDPDQALLVADALWARRTIETRQLAIRLLGAIPASPSSDLTRRLESWVAENREDVLAPEFWDQGILYLSRQFPQELIRFAGNLTRNPDVRKQIFAFGSLRNLLVNNPKVNIPAIFFVLANFDEDPVRKLRPYLADLFSALAERSPGEAVFFLKERMENSKGEGMLWVVRQAAKRLPEEHQAQLRQTF
ncbi:MAG: hypothetical protein ACRDFQ_06365 [Anaerolineales bacterium]